MKWLKKYKGRRITQRERAAAARTAEAEAKLKATEEKIHELAAQARKDLKAGH